MENKRDIRIERLEKLKNATILNFTDTINYDSKLDSYDTLLENVFNGNFDDLFLSNNVSSNDKEIFEIARKYLSLCFFEGDYNYWPDSVEGVYLDDVDLVVIKILDNYDFLLRLVKEVGEDGLKELVNYQKTKVFDGKVLIDYLRNAYINDDMLVSTIKSMSDKNGPYKDFTSEQKALLCLYPEGVIYKVNKDGSVENISTSKIISEIKIYLFGEDKDYFHLGDVLKHLSITDFNEMLNKIYDEYEKEIGIGKK